MGQVEAKVGRQQKQGVAGPQHCLRSSFQIPAQVHGHPLQTKNLPMRLKHSMRHTQVSALLRFKCEKGSSGELEVLWILIHRCGLGLRFCVSVLFPGDTPPVGPQPTRARGQVTAVTHAGRKKNLNQKSQQKLGFQPVQRQQRGKIGNTFPALFLSMAFREQIQVIKPEKQ